MAFLAKEAMPSERFSEPGFLGYVKARRLTVVGRLRCPRVNNLVQFRMVLWPHRILIRVAPFSALATPNRVPQRIFLGLSPVIMMLIPPWDVGRGIKRRPHPGPPVFECFGNSHHAPSAPASRSGAPT